jgi:hypothetical protein
LAFEELSCADAPIEVTLAARKIRIGSRSARRRGTVLPP